MDLNSRGVLKQSDPRGVLELTEGFPSQCRDAWRLAQALPLHPLATRPGVVVFAGMGGSAIGGDFLRVLVESQGTAPVVVHRDYGLPHYVGRGDLVFCVSYSGDTEETLTAYDAARQSGARLVVVTSGGELGARADRADVDRMHIPAGLPPRSALGYLFIPLVVTAERLGLLPMQAHSSAFDTLDRWSELAGVANEESINGAKILARHLHGTLPVLHGVGAGPAVVARRWQTQLNENAKVLAFASAYPELDHNEIVGWIGAGEQGVRKFQGVRISFGDRRLDHRAGITERLLGDHLSFHPVMFHGGSLYEKLLTGTYFGDWVALYLARLNGVDPGSIERIDTLKRSLAE